MSDIGLFNSGPGDRGPVWVKDARAIGLQTFENLGFPTSREEEWRYTNVGPIAKGGYAAAPYPTRISKSDVEPFIYLTKDWTTLVFVDGLLAPAASSMPMVDGADIMSLADCIPAASDLVQEHLGKHVRAGFSVFTALNAAYLRDGAYIYVRPHVVVEKPIHLLYVASGDGQSASYLRNLILLGDHAEATIIESFVSLQDGDYLTSTVTELAVGEGAKVDYYRIQQESKQAKHVSVVGVTQERESSFTSTTVNLGGELVRNDLNIVLNGERAECVMNGLSIVDGNRHVDNHTALDHAAPRCESQELYKAIVDDHARSVFNGKIYVRPNAQKTDAKQTNKNLLMSKDATVNTKPQLEIFANDVKCTHGATVGQLDDSQMFYLRSRGLSEDVASQLLTYGFANDIIEKVRPEPLRRYLHKKQVEALNTSADITELA